MYIYSKNKRKKMFLRNIKIYIMTAKTRSIANNDYNNLRLIMVLSSSKIYIICPVL